MTTPHTKGPWRIVGGYIASAAETVVASFIPPAEPLVVWADSIAGLETLANGRVLALSPEMFELLERTGELLEEAIETHIYGDDDERPSDCAYSGAVREIRALLARAAGEPS